MLIPTAPVNIPSRGPSRGSTPPPDLPQLEWSGSPESPSLATPQTPAILTLLGPHPVALEPTKRHITYAYELPSTSFPSSYGDPSRHRRRSSIPFAFELGDAAIDEGSEPDSGPTLGAPDPAPTTPQATPARGSGTSTPTSPSSSFGAAVRRQIARSKTSMRQLRGDDDEGEAPRQRLKSLITRRSRAQSMTSSPSPSIIGSVSSSAQVSVQASLDMEGYDDVGIMPGRRARGKSIVQNARERLQRRRSSFAGLPTPPVTPTFNVAFTSAGVHSAAPLPSDEIVWGTLSYRAPPTPQPVDHFDTTLPRELKVAVFRTLLEDWEARGGNGRWDGVNGGRRELVRLSRVSKEWRSLCFDGQLWAHCDLTPFVTVLPSATLRAILLNARACVKSLSLHGLESLNGSALVCRSEPRLPNFSSLASLDLRGCHSVSEVDVIDLLALAPGLKALNLKGSRVATIYTLDAIRNKIDALEELDVSRCWQLRFLDIDKFVVSLTPPQRRALTTLRVAGLPMASGYLLQHVPDCAPNLECLDLMGCSWIGMRDMQEYVAALGDRPSSLRHLVISNCTGLTPEALELLVDRMPEMRILEAANLESVFYLDPPPTLSRLVRSMPKLERIDLDGSGRYGGVEDRLLHELIPGACRGSPLEESRLVELRIGNAKFVTKAAIMRLIEGLPNLLIFIVDGTEADDAVMKEWHRRHPSPESVISMIDCSLSSEAYDRLAPKTRPRRGWADYRGAPFRYTSLELAERPVVRAFWAWRRVGVPLQWRQAREAGERELEQRQRDSVPSYDRYARRPSWWATRNDDIDMERGACTVM
ncbi:hypothetical protein CspHIS471_0308290 [Cutaneotrichosporon sp. HIS471]|nr:hypothetical protein CspHIS471_0308290 [Cutaneotrichosporon sp. HIS471]